MKGFRKAGGGGFLHETAGVIEGYKFESTKWGTGDDAYHSLSVRLDIRPDGAEEAVPQFIPAGFFYPDNQTISDDGLTIDSDREGAVLTEGTEFFKFLESMVKAGLDEELIGEGRNFEFLNGMRVQFVKAINEDRQIAAGKKKLGKAKAATASKDELLKAGRQQDKKDKTKFYNHQLLLVSELLAAPEAAPKKSAAKTTAKAAPKAAAKSTAPAAKGKAAKAEAGDTAQADTVITDLLADAKDNTVDRKSVSSLIVRYALKNSLSADDRESLRKQIHSEDYLNDAVERGIVAYDADAQTISLAA